MIFERGTVCKLSNPQINLIVPALIQRERVCCQAALKRFRRSISHCCFAPITVGRGSTLPLIIQMDRSQHASTLTLAIDLVIGSHLHADDAWCFRHCETCIPISSTSWSILLGHSLFFFDLACTSQTSLVSFDTLSLLLFNRE